MITPALGAKITALIDRRNGHDWIWKDHRRLPLADLPLRGRTPSSPPFADSDLSGFDECFPSVGPGTYPGDERVPLPDHGETWSQSWTCWPIPGGVRTTFHGRVLPYTLTRELRLRPGARMRLDYQLTNHASVPLVHGWSAHPLFKAAGACQVLIPAGSSMRREFGLGPRIVGDPNPPPGQPAAIEHWPHVETDGRTWDLSDASRSVGPSIDKVVVDTPAQGWVAILDCAGRWLRLDIAPSSIPYVGVCTNLSRWPQPRPQRWIALEPSFASSDRLDTAVSRGEAGVLRARGTQRWTFTIAVGEGPDPAP